MTDAPEATEAPQRGRPRPAATRERDDSVLKVITEASEPLSREQIAETLGLVVSAVYLSIYRLRTTNQIHKIRVGKAVTWAVGADPANAATETPA